MQAEKMCYWPPDATGVFTPPAAGAPAHGAIFCLLPFGDVPDQRGSPGREFRRHAADRHFGAEFAAVGTAER